MVRQGHLIAVVGAFLMGCTVLVVGGSGVQAEATEEQGDSDRCEGTRNIVVGGARYATNDVPGCPKGGLLSATARQTLLRGEKGDDEVRGLGGSDELYGGYGSDVIYAGPGDDFLEGEQDDDVLYGGDGGDIYLLGGRGDDVLYGGEGNEMSMDGGRGEDVLYGGEGNDTAEGPPDVAPTVPSLNGGPGEDVLYGGEGNDYLDGRDEGVKEGQRDKLYCGAGRDRYLADTIDYVSSSCEEGELVDTGGPPLILLAGAALLLGSGVLIYAFLRRR